MGKLFNYTSQILLSLISSFFVVVVVVNTIVFTSFGSKPKCPDGGTWNHSVNMSKWETVKMIPIVKNALWPKCSWLDRYKPSDSCAMRAPNADDDDYYDRDEKDD